jgi:hypothetical protein
MLLKATFVAKNKQYVNAIFTYFSKSFFGHLGFFFFGAGTIIHLLLILVVTSLIARYVIEGKILGNIKKVKPTELMEHKFNNL